MIKYKEIMVNKKNVLLESSSKKAILTTINESISNKVTQLTISFEKENNRLLDTIERLIESKEIVTTLDLQIIFKLSSYVNTIVEFNEKSFMFTERIEEVNNEFKPLISKVSKMDKESVEKKLEMPYFERQSKTVHVNSLIRLATSYEYYLEGWYGNKRYDLDMNVDFQRDLVWSLEQKQKLIISLLNQTPIGNFYINVLNTTGKNSLKERTELDNVLYDGKQRLSTVIDYMNGDFPVVINGQTYFYNNLSTTNKGNIFGATINVYETYFNSKKELIDFYVLINTGQTLHTEEDIRKAMKLKN